MITSKTYWVHVACDGTEQVYPESPTDRPTLHVWAAMGREYTITASLITTLDMPGWALHEQRQVSLRWPPGQNWKYCNRVPIFIKPLMRADSQVWSRKAVHDVDLKVHECS